MHAAEAVSSSLSTFLILFLTSAATGGIFSQASEWWFEWVQAASSFRWEDDEGLFFDDSRVRRVRDPSPPELLGS